ncbi:hypothetical protein [Clostridium intestinale]|uniref:hypothetical protein n=1 Tax=Clostridium intestinale TaxID=36845 RepID=UPI002DD62954|nr:hypothetical protein [Clostridium intestinale]WRY50597.1 hypothetical protein P8F83_18200 [Clostridium intestinale]
MKIEMCESLVKSWLKHIEECNVTELNYKPSNLWGTYDEETISELFEKVRVEFTNNGIGIFKNNSSWNQLIKQAEIDVLGVKLLGNEVQDYYLVEVAFHEGGVNYGNKEITIANILKKIIRAIFILYCKFGSKKGKIIFTAPKMSYLSEIDAGIIKLREIINETIKDNNYEIKIIANDDFKDGILNKVLVNSNVIADTSELFLRSYQLLNMFETTLNDIKDIKIQSQKRGNYRTRDLISDEALDNEHKVAYYLSRFEHDLLFPELNQTDAFIRISEILQIKDATLRQKRDRFDPFCNSIKTRGNKRKGYWQYESLPDDMQRIYDKYINISEEELRNEIKMILKIE